MAYLNVQRIAGIATEDECDVCVQLGAVLAQRQNSNTDDRKDELQPLHVTMHADGELR